MVVRIEEVALEFGVAGDVDLRDAIRGHGVEIEIGIESVILRRDVNVVHVEQDAAVGALDDFVEKLPLGHLRGVKLRVAADILHRDGHVR